MATDSGMPVSLTGPTLVRSRAITDADTGTTVKAIEVPANTFIPPYGVTVHVVTLFAGGTESLDVGDDTNGDGWVDSTDITETSTGTYSGTEANTDAYAQTGKLYTSADTLDVVVNASLTAGCAYITALMYDLSDETLEEV